MDLPFQFKTLEGKAACPGNCKGSIINLGMGGMLARTDAEVVPYSNILFRLDIDIFNVRTGEICGKVLEVKDKGEYREIRIGFTSLDPGDREIIQSLLNRLDGSFPR
ncbi:MAG: PilZ domain-containing protein [Deltaproteobacteria bacterium]|nr:PilZ domain-containing protein [Deltaproteobacteria bacterium]